MLALTLLAAFTQVPAGGPGAMHYRYESKASTTIDMSATGGGSQDIAITSMALLSVTVHDTAGGQLAEIVIDSVTYDAGEMMAQAAAILPPEATASGKGAVYHVYVVDGAPSHIENSAPKNLQALSAAGAVQLLFPGLRAGATSGARWTDTTTSDTTMSIGAHGTVTTITAWTVSSQDGDSTIVDGNVSGNMNLQTGMTGQLDMANTGTRHVVLTAAGVARQASMLLRTTGSMTMGTTVIPIRATSTATLTRLP
jgi:hypothetical protein